MRCSMRSSASRRIQLALSGSAGTGSGPSIGSGSCCRSRFVQHVEESVLDATALAAVIDRIGNRELDPYSAAEETLRRALGQASAPGSPRGPVLDHVGIAVADIAEALGFYRDALGLPVEAPEDVASQRVRAHFIPAGGAALELLEATAPDSADCEIPREARCRASPHHALRGRHRGRTGSPESQRRSADRRGGAARRARLAGRVRSSGQRARRARRAQGSKVVGPGLPPVAEAMAVRPGRESIYVHHHRNHRGQRSVRHGGAHRSRRAPGQHAVWRSIRGVRARNACVESASPFSPATASVTGSRPRS